MNNKTIPVVFATDEKYVPYCGVAISSLIANANSDTAYEVYVLYDSMTSLSVCRLERLSTCNVRVKCCCVHESIKKLKVVEHYHLTIASAFRLVIPDVLPQYDKVLYLDSDIIIDADVAELFDIDIGDCILGAAHGYLRNVSDSGAYDENDFIYNHIKNTLRVDINNFFNAGILIINNTAFKKHDVASKCFDLLSSRNDLYFMDQCALNITCEGKVYFIPKRWNHEWQYLFAVNNPSIPRTAEEFETCPNPAIIHYVGIEKPWDYPEQFLSDVFWKYARQTVFYEEILYRAQMHRTREMLELSGMSGKTMNIAIYGAGSAGQRYVGKILLSNMCNIAVWVDKNYNDKKGCQLPVENPGKLYTTEFDRVLIAIENAVISNQVKETLVKNGIPEDKIIQIRDK